MSEHNVGYNLEKILVFWGETPLYVGAEREAGSIDLSLQRNIITNVPEPRSTSLKGALRNFFEILSLQTDSKLSSDEIKEIFGDENKIGLVSFLDLKILLFPVNSSIGNFVYITSRNQLEALNRLLAMTNKQPLDTSKIEIDPGESIASQLLSNFEEIYLLNGSKRLKIKQEAKNMMPPIIDTLIDIIKMDSAGYDYYINKIKNYLLIVSDEDFSDIVNKGLIRTARIKLDAVTKRVETGALFYQELIPEMTILFTGIFSNPRRTAKRAVIDRFLKILDGLLINLGGDESTGRGFVRIKVF